jgi:hypothetical protein
MGQSLRKNRGRREPGPAGGAAPAPQQLQTGPISTAAQQLFPRFGMVPMTREVQIEFSRALDRGFGSLPYGIIGPAAFPQYGVDVYPSNIDVIVSPVTREIARAQLLRRKVGFIPLDEARDDSGRLG